MPTILANFAAWSVFAWYANNKTWCQFGTTNNCCKGISLVFYFQLCKWFVLLSIAHSDYIDCFCVPRGVAKKILINWTIVTTSIILHIIYTFSLSLKQEFFYMKSGELRLLFMICEYCFSKCIKMWQSI